MGAVETDAAKADGLRAETANASDDDDADEEPATLLAT
jgi:hypothetical protein